MRLLYPKLLSVAIHYIFINILSLVFLFVSNMLASCNKEDDINSIFAGKTWYITGATINGSVINGELLKELYVSPSSYFIQFSSDNTFNGVLVAGSSIAGTWNANGKKNTFSFHFSKSTDVNNSSLSNNIFNILKDASSYNGDENNVIIKEDNQNIVRFTINRFNTH